MPPSQIAMSAAARALDARDAGQVHACLADQVSAHLEVALRARRARIRSEPLERGCRRGGDGRQVERVHTDMVGDAEAGAEHQRLGAEVELLSEVAKDAREDAEVLADGLRVHALRPRVRMEPDEP